MVFLLALQFQNQGFYIKAIFLSHVVDIQLCVL